MKLKKKLREIEKLEAQATPLQANQVEKVKLKSDLLAQLEALGPEEIVESSAVHNEDPKDATGRAEGAEEKTAPRGKGKGKSKGKGYTTEGAAKKSKESGKG